MTYILRFVLAPIALIFDTVWQLLYIPLFCISFWAISGYDYFTRKTTIREWLMDFIYAVFVIPASSIGVTWHGYWIYILRGDITYFKQYMK